MEDIVRIKVADIPEETPMDIMMSLLRINEEEETSTDDDELVR